MKMILPEFTQKGQSVIFNEFNCHCTKCGKPLAFKSFKVYFNRHENGSTYFDLPRPLYCLYCYDKIVGIHVLGFHEQGNAYVYKAGDYPKQEMNNVQRN